MSHPGRTSSADSGARAMSVSLRAVLLWGATCRAGDAALARRKAGLCLHGIQTYPPRLLRILPCLTMAERRVPLTCRCCSWILTAMCRWRRRRSSPVPVRAPPALLGCALPTGRRCREHAATCSERLRYALQLAIAEAHQCGSVLPLQAPRPAAAPASCPAPRSGGARRSSRHRKQLRQAPRGCSSSRAPRQVCARMHACGVWLRRRCSKGPELRGARGRRQVIPPQAAPSAA